MWCHSKNAFPSPFSFNLSVRALLQMITLYGIKNCDTIKKARKWLDENGVAYQFHDFRKDGLEENLLRKWVKEVGWEVLLNKRGTTWRKLDDEVKEKIDESSAIQVMLENPSIIKRPVLVTEKVIQVGFSGDQYQQLFT